MTEPALERYFEISGKDVDAAHELYAPDAVLEFPQSGERFVGVENFREWRRQYPAAVTYKIRRMNRWGDLVVAELFVSYDDNPPMYGVALIELNTEDQIVLSPSAQHRPNSVHHLARELDSILS